LKYKTIPFITRKAPLRRRNPLKSFESDAPPQNSG
jgi:hypothetical protein